MTTSTVHFLYFYSTLYCSNGNLAIHILHLMPNLSWNSLLVKLSGDECVRGKDEDDEEEEEEDDADDDAEDEDEEREGKMAK